MRSKNKEPSLKRQEVKNQLETMLTEFSKLSIRIACFLSFCKNDLHCSPQRSASQNVQISRFAQVRTSRLW